MTVNPLKDVYRTYSLLHRAFPCSHCGVAVNEKCIGTSGEKIEACHLDRKQKCAMFRRENPEAYRALRNSVARALLNLEAKN